MTKTKIETKLTTSEVTNSRLLMSMIAGKPGEKSRTAERVVQTVDAELREKGSVDLPIYDVRVSINGIELDFRDFTDEVTRQLDTLVMREAGELLKRTVGNQLDDLLRATYESLHRLNEGVQKKATELLGYNPWKDEL